MKELLEIREVIAVHAIPYFTETMHKKYASQGYEIVYDFENNAVRVFGYDKPTEYWLRGFWERKRRY